MDRVEQDCWLDWWANSVTNLGGFSVSVTIAATPDGWDAHGHLTDDALNDDARDGFHFLCDLDPVFTLQFHDDSSVQVVVTRTDQNNFTLAEYTGPTHRKISYRMTL
jgi:hypothetical protein